MSRVSSSSCIASLAVAPKRSSGASSGVTIATAMSTAPSSTR
jgi:hypothetical protein